MALGSEEILTKFKTEKHRERCNRQERSIYPVEIVQTDSKEEQQKVDPMPARDVAEKTSDYADQQKEV